MQGVLERLEAIASQMPVESVALSSAGQQLSYTELCAAIKKYADWFRNNDVNVVALQSGNNIDWVLIDLACQAAGRVLIPLPTFFTPDQVRQCLLNAGVDMLLTEQKHLPGLDAETLHHFDVERPFSLDVWKISADTCASIPERTQKITFTSGSTGHPKGVCLNLEHQWRVAESLAETIDIKVPRHLCLLPLSTLLENVAGVYAPLLNGGEVIIPQDAERGMLGSSQLDSKALLNCISNAQPMTMILVPQLLFVLIQACMNGWQAPSSLKLIAVGGGKVSPQLIRQARNFGLPVYQGYGLSECGSVVALNTPSDDRIDSVGRVLPHCSVAIENSEVVVSGAGHLGYLNDPQSWYPGKIHTGDTGSLADDFLNIDGRIKNILITRFGRNVSPEWVESVLMSVSIFSHCVVLGDDRPYLVAILSTSLPLNDSEIDRWVNECNQSLPDYAQIGGWLRLSDSDIQPFLTANGRPQREKIQQAYSARIDPLYTKDNASVQTREVL